MCSVPITKQPPPSLIGILSKDEKNTCETNASSLSKAKKDKSRGVRFSSSATVYHLLDLPVASDMTDEEVDVRWYTSAEQRSFVDSAKKVCMDFLEGKHSNNRKKSFPGSQKDLSLEQDDADCETMRGLDHQVSLLRKKKKETAINVILECQRRLRIRDVTSTKKAIIDKDTYLALVSAKVTRFAREVALRTALNDFIAAYPDRKFGVGSLIGSTIVSSEKCIRKRKTVTKSVAGKQGRRVRMRMIVQETKQETINSQATVLIVP